MPLLFLLWKERVKLNKCQCWLKHVDVSVCLCKFVVQLVLLARFSFYFLLLERLCVMVCSLKFSLAFWHSFSFIRKALIYHLFYFCVSTHKMREWNVFCFLFTYCHYFIRCTFLLPFPSFYYHYTLTLISPVDKQFTFPAETRFTFSQRRRHFDAIVVHWNMYSFFASSIRVVINCQFVTLFCLQVEV